jgi:hypothetical protein
MGCFDTLAGFPFSVSDTEKQALMQSIIETLGDYPKPQHRSDATGAGAYIFVSMARYTAKMAKLGYLSYSSASGNIAGYFERALGLLTDERN